MNELMGRRRNHNSGPFTFNSDPHLNVLGPVDLIEDAIEEIFKKFISIFNFENILNNSFVEGEVLNVLGVDPNSDIGTIANEIEKGKTLAKKIENSPELKNEVVGLIKEGTKVGEAILPDVEDSINQLTDDANKALQETISKAEDDLTQTGEMALMSAAAAVPVAGPIIDAAFTVGSAVDVVDDAMEPWIKNLANATKTISDAGQKVKDELDPLKNAVQTTTNKVNNAVQTTTDNVTNKVNNAVQTTTDSVTSNVNNAVQTTTDNVTNKVNNAVQTTTDNVTNKVNNALQGATSLDRPRRAQAQQRSRPGAEVLGPQGGGGKKKKKSRKNKKKKTRKAKKTMLRIKSIVNNFTRKNK
jgi:ElaB/YqjD/DUF883 family membrane-anchored ribosome-binding protein